MVRYGADVLRRIRGRSERRENDAIDMRRRNFIKLTVFGGIIFLVGRYFGPLVNMFRGDTVINEMIFSNFKITETGKQLRVTDDEGSEILTIDKEHF